VTSTERGHADFTILDRNPLDVDSPDELRNIEVLGTVMGGKAFPAGALRKDQRQPPACRRPENVAPGRSWVEWLYAQH
jgi:hypothetical protein